VEDSLSFLNLLTYSPYHTIEKDKLYPPMLIITSDHDDRVAPVHSYKFVAQLQSKAAKKNPYLLHVIEDSVHWGSSVLMEKRENKGLTYAFIFNSLEMSVR
jgi:prolyl oligopeptidase